jgi:hypothetical protein
LLVLIALLIAVVLGYAIQRVFLGYPRPPADVRRLAAREVAFLHAAAEAMFPAAGAIPLSGLDADVPRYVDRYFAVLVPVRRLQMRLLFALIEQATIVFPAPGASGFRRFSALSRVQREAALQGWADSRLALRRLVFTALRAVLTMGYLGHPRALASLGLAPLELPRPVVEADLLYPRAGQPRSSIRFTRGDLSPPSGVPVDPSGPVHPDYRESPL